MKLALIGWISALLLLHCPSTYAQLTPEGGIQVSDPSAEQSEAAEVSATKDGNGINQANGTTADANSKAVQAELGGTPATVVSIPIAEGNSAPPVPCLAGLTGSVTDIACVADESDAEVLDNEAAATKAQGDLGDVVADTQAAADLAMTATTVHQGVGATNRILGDVVAVGAVNAEETQGLLVAKKMETEERAAKRDRFLGFLGAMAAMADGG
jgi:hypothetical protein